MRIARSLPAAAAVAALAACGSHAGSAAPAAAPVATAGCHQQYMAWKTGPADAEGKQMESALNAIQTAGDDMVTLQSGLKQAGAIARQLQAYPIPSCADRGGYWKQILTEITAAGDNAGTATGLTGLIAAEVPLQKVPALESKLTTELKSTAQVNLPHYESGAPAPSATAAGAIRAAHLHTVELSSFGQARLAPATGTSQHTVGCRSSNAPLTTAGINGAGHIQGT